MSVTKSLIAFGLDIKPYCPSQNPLFSNSSANLLMVKKRHNGFFDKQGLKRLNNVMGVQKDDGNTRSLVVYSVVQPGAPPPSEPPFNFLKWIVGVVLSIVLPFLTHNKWASILKLKNEVDTAVETIEVIVDAVEKVAEEVEKAAEHIASSLPEGGTLRKAVDFVESVAEVTSKEAHLVGDFIDKVQEAEEKVEACVESMAEEVVHPHPTEEDRANEQIKELNKN
ncbi:uncharacterized protein LOC110011739 isoform X2 [Sesamum indicum]|uniref:Uncharacterized protein LOC110011739 isoform X2 n=1 Tax=Sesamum indicum TaxID=4182 RepID=A0A8M8UPT8_SESIN|nr:uncharacterized protein LOC110011739 isoform X2 [Sesamum indicum]